MVQYGMVGGFGGGSGSLMLGWELVRRLGKELGGEETGCWALLGRFTYFYSFFGLIRCFKALKTV
jgi:hypothetical protein